MENNIRSWKFWVAGFIASGIGSIVPFLKISPPWVGGAVILGCMLVVMFYLRVKSGRPFLMAVYTKTGLFAGYSSKDMTYPEPPGPIFEGLGMGSAACLVFYLVIALVLV